MLCCAAGIAAVATGAIGWRRFRRLLRWRGTAQSALAAVVLAVVAITVAGLAVEHLSHHAAYAGEEQALSAEPGVLPTCGAAPADSITETASIEE